MLVGSRAIPISHDFAAGIHLVAAEEAQNTSGFCFGGFGLGNYLGCNCWLGGSAALSRVCVALGVDQWSGVDCCSRHAESSRTGEHTFDGAKLKAGC